MFYGTLLYSGYSHSVDRCILLYVLWEHSDLHALVFQCPTVHYTLTHDIAVYLLIGDTVNNNSVVLEYNRKFIRKFGKKFQSVP